MYLSAILFFDKKLFPLMKPFGRSHNFLVPYFAAVVYAVYALDGLNNVSLLCY